MKKILICLFLLMISFVMFIVVNIQAKGTIEWIGHPMVSDNDAYTPCEGWLPTIQIGLREDGVVVWRDVSEKKR